MSQLPFSSDNGFITQANVDATAFNAVTSNVTVGTARAAATKFGTAFNITAADGASDGANGTNINITAGDANESSGTPAQGGTVTIQGGSGTTPGQILIGGGGGNISIGSPGGVISINTEIRSGTSINAPVYTNQGSNVAVAADTQSWTFDTTGNLNLPGNTFAVNYANGIPVSLNGTYDNANVVALLQSFGNNTITTTGNITADYFVGNGSQLSNITGANVTGEVATANTVTNPVQSNITGLGTLTSLSTGSLNASGQFTANANAQFNGNVFFAGNVQIAGNVTQVSGNSAQFFGANATGFGALYAGLLAGYTPLAQEVTQFATNFNGYTQVTMRNISGGDQATGDFVVTADDGNDTTNFINMGFTGSGYNGLLANNSLGTSVFANDGYLYAKGNVAGGNLVLGSGQANGVVRIIANGQSNIGDVVATFGATGLNLNRGNLTLPGNTFSVNYANGTPVQLGLGPSVTSIITAASIAPTAATTQYNVLALDQAATVAAPTGTPVDGAKLTFRIRDSGLAQTLSWNSIYQVIGTTLPTTTVTNKTVYVGCIYNDSELTWDVVSVAQQA